MYGFLLSPRHRRSRTGNINPQRKDIHVPPAAANTANVAKDILVEH